MGNLPSTPAPSCANFDREEMHRLVSKFKKLDVDKSNTISAEEFFVVPEVKSNPLAQRIISLFDQDGNGEVDFKEFIGTLSLFSVKSDNKSKLKFAFRIYDLDSDGFISHDDLFNALKMMVGTNLTTSQLQEICARTIAHAAPSVEGRISFEEFCQIVEKMNVHSKMVVEV